MSNTTEETAPKKRKQDIAADMKAIADQVDNAEVELHFLQVLGASQSSRFREGGLYTLLSHRYVEPGLRHDHDFWECEASSGAEVDHDSTPKAISPPHSPAASVLSTGPTVSEDDCIMYYDVGQNADRWLELRRGKIMVSKVGELIGLSGYNKLLSAWRELRGNKQENSSNFSKVRGLQYEKEAREKFSQDSGCAVTKCGIFFRQNIGACPDGLLEHPNWLLEIKTRAMNSHGPLESMEKYQYVQVQLQLFCTGREHCVFMSYHPETKTSSYFKVSLDMDFVKLLTTCLESMLKQENIVHENRWDLTCAAFDVLWKVNVNKVPNYRTLYILRRYLMDCVKSILVDQHVKNYF